MLVSLFWIVFYLVGCVVAYAIAARWKIKFTYYPMDREDRALAIFFSCFSWISVALISVMYFPYLLAKIFKPLLKLLEPEAELKEEE